MEGDDGAETLRALPLNAVKEGWGLLRSLGWRRMRRHLGAVVARARGVTFTLRASSMVVLASLLAGCVGGVALSPGEVRDPWNPTQRVDLSNALTDKLAFLRGIPLLGHSKEEDLDLLLRMTGHRFSPKELPGVFPDGQKRYQESAPLFRSHRFLINGRYSYYVQAGKRDLIFVSFAFDKKAACVSVEDLERVLGRPTRILSAGEIPAKGLGPSWIWTVIYGYSSGAGTLYQFSTDVCVNDVTIASDLSTVRIK